MRTRIPGLEPLLFVGILFAFSAVVASCASDESGTTARFKLLMADSPIADADAINVTINSVSVNGPNGWVDLDINPARYDLLELMNNATVTLADQELEEGDYTEIRLVLACDGEEAPAIVIEGQSLPLKVPSGCSSGFKMKGEFTLIADHDAIIIMDFDMNKSIHKTGEGKYILNPVVRLIEGITTGNINGSVTPIVPHTAVYAFPAGKYEVDNFDNATNATLIRVDGTFTLGSLPAGDYDVVVVMDGYITAYYTDGIKVIASQNTNLDAAIVLTPQP